MRSKNRSAIGGIAEIMRGRIRGDVERDVSMALRTTFRVGGKADLVAYPLDAGDLREVVLLARERGIPLSVVGSGSNLLVRDRGIRGVVVSLARGFKRIERLDNDRLSCEAGASLASVVSHAASLGLGGLEFLSGIPGTIGGALRMNAGAFGSEIRDFVEDVAFITGRGDAVMIKGNGLSFSYRNLDMRDGDTIVGCTLSLERRDVEDIRDRMRKYSIERGKRQPLNVPTAGSVFKNPPGDFAGRLIEEAGLKGLHVGKAKVSEKHANFIENLGGARAADILALMDMIKERVYKRSGILLEPEVKIVGEEEPARVRVAH